MFTGIFLKELSLHELTALQINLPQKQRTFLSTAIQTPLN